MSVDSDNIEDITKSLFEASVSKSRPISPTVTRKAVRNLDNTPKLTRHARKVWPEFPEFIKKDLKPENEVHILLHALGVSTDPLTISGVKYFVQRYMKKLRFIYELYDDGEDFKSDIVQKHMEDLEKERSQLVTQVLSLQKSEIVKRALEDE